MPHDMFGDVVARPPAVRSRQSLVLLSICLHAGILVTAIVVSIVAPDVLPFSRQALAFYEPTNVKLVDIDLPAPRRMAPKPIDPSVAPSSAAPVVAPEGIRAETGLENLPLSAPGDVPGAIDAVGPGGVVSELPPAAPPPPSPAPAVRLSSGIRSPQKIGGLPPVYPVLARRAHVEGVVILEATIDTAGQVQNVRVLRSIPLLDEAAVDAVRQWRYEPAELNGQPVAVIMSVTVRFQLQ